MIAAHTPITAPDPAAGLPTFRVPAPPIDPADLPPGIDHPIANEVISHYLRGGQDTDVGELGLTLNLAVRTVIQVIDSPFAQRIFSDIKRLALQRSEIAAAEGRTQAVYVTRRIAATSPSDEVARRAANALLNFRTVTEVPAARGGTDPDATPARPRGPRPPRPTPGRGQPPAPAFDIRTHLPATDPPVTPPPAAIVTAAPPVPPPPAASTRSAPPPAATTTNVVTAPAVPPTAPDSPVPGRPRHAAAPPQPPSPPSQQLTTIALRASALVARLAAAAGAPASMTSPPPRARDSPTAA